MADPPRFSCGVTGDEVKVSGVISYDECGVNTGNMMNTGTGHATVPTDGDYLLTFSANMVSSNSQAVWCALYKQSPGNMPTYKYMRRGVLYTSNLENNTQIFRS